MLALRAVQPEGRLARDHDGVGRHGGVGRGHGHEARPEASPNVGAGQGLAGRIEGRLRDGVVLGRELELHHVADGGFEVLGGVGEGAVQGADADDVDFDACFLGCSVCEVVLSKSCRARKTYRVQSPCSGHRRRKL